MPRIFQLTLISHAIDVSALDLCQVVLDFNTERTRSGLARIDGLVGILRDPRPLSFSRDPFDKVVFQGVVEEVPAGDVEAHLIAPLHDLAHRFSVVSGQRSMYYEIVWDYERRQRVTGSTALHVAAA